jgi:transcriptional regulator with XRE-family HTH domain
MRLTTRLPCRTIFSILDKIFQYNGCVDINKIIASRIGALRETQKLSLDALAALSGVSRSNISLIERAQSSASATVLDKLAAALGVSLSSLFEDNNTPAAAPSPVSRKTDQLVWTDPASGYVRRILSPAAPSSIQLVEVIFPPGQRVVYDAVERNSDNNQQIWMIDGVMDISVGSQHWCLKAGDCLVMQSDQAFVYFNPAQSAAHYLVALAIPPSKPRA